VVHSSFAILPVLFSGISAFWICKANLEKAYSPAGPILVNTSWYFLIDIPPASIYSLKRLKSNLPVSTLVAFFKD
jgi:hypothetical protein